jgi:hypothetical protein
VISLRTLPALLLLLACLPGCPTKEEQVNAAGQPDTASFSPSADIPVLDPLAKYGKLRLGMSNLDLAQAYNAPEGKGEGFSRVVQEFGDARNHIIEFDAQDGEPRRRIVIRVYRDRLAKLVERRDGLTAAQADAWRAELVKAHGEPPMQPLHGAQWSWGDKDGVLLTFTQDNASPTDMSANVVLEHRPTYDASVRYLEEWSKAHPEGSAPVD